MGRPRKYSKKPYRQDRVYSWIKGQGRPVSRGEVMAQFGLTQSSASQLLQRMRYAGIVQKVGGATKHARWELCGKRPYDQRGLSQGSIDALALTQDQWEERLKLANKALGREPPEKFKPRTVARRQPRMAETLCTLQQLWTIPARTYDDHSVTVRTGTLD